MAKNASLKRFDEMDFKEVSERYAVFFEKLIGKKQFYKVCKENKLKCKRMESAVKRGLKFPGGTRRGHLSAGRNMLYGWLLEELMFFVLLKHSQIKKVTFWGEDKQHDFNEENGKVVISGKRTTGPDYNILLANDKRLFLELKSAARGIYSIKRGNVSELIFSFAKYSIPTAIMMLDCNTAKYEIKTSGFFEGTMPFVNVMQEGQLCYHFPEPKRPLEEFFVEDLIDLSGKSERELKKNPRLPKYLLLEKAIKLDAKQVKQAIKKKMEIEEIEMQKLVQIKELDEKIASKKKKNEESCLSWEEIEKRLCK